MTSQRVHRYLESRPSRSRWLGPKQPQVLLLAGIGLLSLLGVSCGSSSEPEEAVVLVTTTQPSTTPPPSVTVAQVPQITGLPITIPDWLYTRPLPTNAAGFASSVPTPPELIDRKLPPQDVLPLPTTFEFKASINPFDGEPLARSTWQEGCPVPPEDLRYVTVTFWGFDERPHRGEMVLHKDVAIDLVGVFQEIYDARFPIEEMRIITPEDLSALPTGDGNISASYVCRPVTGGAAFSQHAYGLAIDVNPFHNPYIKGEVLLPELATYYADRTTDLPGMLDEQSVPVQAFRSIGWGWGGDWNSLKDYQHFSQNNR